jgi:hypothetical protein
VPPVRGKVGRPRRRPEPVIADRGYDHDKYRCGLRRRRITPEIARRQTAHGSGLGRARWVVERTFAHLHHFKRLLRGLIVSEYEPGIEPAPWRFPAPGRGRSRFWLVPSPTEVLVDLPSLPVNAHESAYP